MTAAGLSALRAERLALLSWVRGADDSVWSTTTDTGWTREEILVHLTELFRRVVDPAARPSRDDDVAARSAAAVRDRADLPIGERIDEFGHASNDAIELLAGMQAPVAGDLLLHFGTAGQHPTHLWADGLVYELLVHRCFDLGVGDVRDGSLPPAIAWLLSSLPQVAHDRIHPLLAAPVALHIGPPVATPVTLWRVGDAVALGDSADGPRAAAAAIEVDPVALLRAGSGRSRWHDEDVRITGDARLGAAVLDQVRI